MGGGLAPHDYFLDHSNLKDWKVGVMGEGGMASHALGVGLQLRVFQKLHERRRIQCIGQFC